MDLQTIIATDDDGDEIRVDVGNLVVWIDMDKHCLSFTDKRERLKEFAESILDALKQPTI